MVMESNTVVVVLVAVMVAVVVAMVMVAVAAMMVVAIIILKATHLNTSSKLPQQQRPAFRAMAGLRQAGRKSSASMLKFQQRLSIKGGHRGHFSISVLISITAMQDPVSR